MQLHSDDFALFGLPRRFALDAAELAARRRSLLAEVHPDRFATGAASAQRIALQWTVRLNEAYERLKDPLNRAAYLCELEGAPIRAEDNTAMPGAFLVQQMEWRESLDEACTTADVEALGSAIEAHRRSAYERLASTLDGDHDYRRGAEQVRALMFVERFADDVADRLHALDA